MLTIALALHFATAITLYEVPAEFQHDLPIVQVSLVQKDGSGGPTWLALDSGAVRSFSSTGLPIKGELSVPGHDEEGLGKITLSDSGLMNKEMLKVYEGKSAKGALGSDFLANHDVLIDFKSRRVFISAELASGERHAQSDVFTLLAEPSGDRQNGAANGQIKLGPLDLNQAADLNLLMIDARPHVVTYMKQRPKEQWLPMLDTWTETVLISDKKTDGLKKTGETIDAVGMRKTFKIERAEADIQFIPKDSRHVEIFSNGEGWDILGMVVFKDASLLLQLREHVARVWNGSAMVAAATPNS